MDFENLRNWNPEIEKEIVEKWKNSEMFKFNFKTKKKIYSIDTPPPYVNAPIHMGHVVTYCYMDFFARYKRMKGFEVLFPLGLDRNGLPIEMAAEKKFNISPFKMGREEFLLKCKEILENTSSETEDTFAKLGISFTSYKKGDHIGAVYLTDSPEYRKMTQATFIELYKKGLIYEDTRINNWDTRLQTTIADSEIEYKDIETMFNHVKWKVKETKEEIQIGTTRPELICTCAAVIFNPDDKRYKHLQGKTAITPLFGKEVPIMAHKFASQEKGTGLAMMCSAGDLSDIQFFREQRIKPLIAIEKNGQMNRHAGPLNGLKVKEARERVINDLREHGLLAKQEKILHRTPVSERSGAEIEFIEMPEYYLEQLNMRSKMKDIAERINFFPETSKKILLDWIDSIAIDWPISRRRFYATSIPVWNSELKGEKIIALAKPGAYYEPWKEKPKNNFEVYKKGKKIGTVKDFAVEWQGEERVFDTWMDSSISELVILKYMEDKKFFKKAYPCSLRPQGKEIIRTWLYYTLLRGYFETGKPAFRDVWIHQHIVDSEGNKMAKSKGNVIDPQKLLKEYGGEAIRFWASVEGDLSKQDLKCSEERIRAEVKTLTKLINVSKFVMMFKKPKTKPKLSPLDNLFINYIDKLTLKIDKCYDEYDFYTPAIKLRTFLWDLFASNYIEIVKARAYNNDKKFARWESDSAKFTLHYLLERFLVLSHPIIPQITSVILAKKGINFLRLEFPKPKKIEFNSALIDKIIDFNSKIWKEKNEKGISLRNEIEGIEIPEELKLFEKDLKTAHNLI
ncbi:MAG: valine--tRNA ligase [Candidatus Pacearchaeota archaeon]